MKTDSSLISIWFVCVVELRKNIEGRERVGKMLRAYHSGMLGMLAKATSGVRNNLTLLVKDILHSDRHWCCKDALSQIKSYIFHLCSLGIRMDSDLHQQMRKW
ncbi:hypothetical protein QVD17_10369 [Tagetes erecta]|uniref:Uncharacterized protein n=1 Tax=Tagetes erecta TaxID=13708 RepID=A0AAD8P5V7_TARER|nr:hypothetical protein QVD17_10369 [Tagetes erecta]